MPLGNPVALSKREREVLRLLLVGHDAKSIARTLGLSVHTVNDRLREARRKLGVSSSREAARRLAEMDGADPNSVVPKEFGHAEVAPSPERTDAPAVPRSAQHRLAWFTGGMLMMSLVIAVVALSTLVGGLNSTQAPAPSVPSVSPPLETEASSAARKWVDLLDASQWDASWRAAAKVFQSSITSAQWEASNQSVREPLGRVSSRILQSAVQTKTLPGAPAGDYQVLQFQTRFASKPEGVETVVLSHENGSWRVSGYFIR
ncbi:DUF4019 domain-containing protein [Sphingomonas sp. CFBP 13714]|uniref:helix-turn-helix domain-containing protein n=1 Tax=Sphingomonas sp. CFBP 13714 TaxID=2775308 RepID=UPI001780DA4F|nr:DUF4019 domain-containing protein [Sphingomonas sp. CFBP 13714]MBD8702112.1 DUF4019 domain-containing protein [Sphingomonas sp. CFBP 13714]